MRRMLDDDDPLEGTEDLIRTSIRMLINPPRNRILSQEQWWARCLEIDNMIIIAIKDGRLPKKMDIIHFVRSKVDFLLKGAVSRAEYIRQFETVYDYLTEKEKQPDDWRARSYEELIA